MTKLFKFTAVRNDKLSFDIEKLGPSEHNFTFLRQFDWAMYGYIWDREHYKKESLDHNLLVRFPSGIDYNPYAPSEEIHDIYAMNSFDPENLGIYTERRHKIVKASKSALLDRTRNIAQKMFDFSKTTQYNLTYNDYVAKNLLPETALSNIIAVNFMYSYETIDKNTVILGIHNISTKKTKRYKVKHLYKFEEMNNTPVEQGLYAKTEQYYSTQFLENYIEDARPISIKDEHILEILKVFKFYGTDNVVRLIK